MSTTTESDLPAVATLGQVCQFMQWSRSTGYRMAERGELPGAVKTGGVWRVHREQFLAAVFTGSDQ